MFTYLFIWVCASVATDDCQVYAPRAWEGPNAATRCDLAIEAHRIRAQREHPDSYIRAFCDSGTTGE